MAIKDEYKFYFAHCVHLSSLNSIAFIMFELFTVKTVHAYASNFEVSCPTFECRMQRFGNSLQRFVPNVPTFRKNVRSTLTNFIQNLFWRVRFSNEDFKMVEDGLASFSIVKI